jgi:hypothetical protein
MSRKSDEINRQPVAFAMENFLYRPMESSSNTADYRSFHRLERDLAKVIGNNPFGPEGGRCLSFEKLYKKKFFDYSLMELGL